MKIGYYCESPADREALKVFTEAILGAPPEPINMDIEARSMPGFFTALDGVLRGVHFNSDAEGLVIVADCDRTEPHDTAHDAPDAGSDRCRLCQVRKLVARVMSQVMPRKDRPALRIAIGLAVPMIDAWYLFGKDHQVGEAAWRAGLAAGKPPFSKDELKKQVYGTPRPSLERATEVAVAEARRVSANLAGLEAAFPCGFGSLFKTIRSWQASPQA